MLNKKVIAPILGLAVTAGLVGCEGNSSSTVIAGSPSVVPTVVDKAMAPVEWDSNNEALVASHVYRSIAKNSVLLLGFTEELASVKTLLSLFRLQDNRSCFTSGSIKSEKTDDICYSDNEVTKIDCTVLDDSEPPQRIFNPDLVVKTNTQLSLAKECQDGVYSARYFDGFLNYKDKDDLGVINELRGSTSVSAIGEVPEINAQGEAVTNNDGDPQTITLTDYQYKTDSFTYFFDHEYELFVDLVNTPINLSACTSGIEQLLSQQGIRSLELGGFEEKGADGYAYNRLTNFDLTASPTHSCDGETLNRALAYTLTSTIESKAIGGGDDAKTTINWTNAYIPQEFDLVNKPKGEITLVHQNPDTSDYTVTIHFDENTGTVTLNEGEVNQVIFDSAAEFLELSEPVVTE